MKLPKVLSDLVAAQNNFDSSAYADCFSETAVVHDEGNIHTGKAAIKSWISRANDTYKTVMKPIYYSEITQTLIAEISGTFPGSPIEITYQFELKNGHIDSLKIV